MVQFPEEDNLDDNDEPDMAEYLATGNEFDENLFEDIEEEGEEEWDDDEEEED